MFVLCVSFKSKCINLNLSLNDFEIGNALLDIVEWLSSIVVGLKVALCNGEEGGNQNSYISRHLLPELLRYTLLLLVLDLANLAEDPFLILFDLVYLLF